ncbi:MAG: chemotaxis protein CheW [Bacillota bacterium]|jgi:purine-binding chemotaxis protein CheW
MNTHSGDLEEQVVVFQLANQICGIGIGAVVEIIRMEKITQVPGAPDFVEGIINIRGRVIPVIDLRTRFEFEALDFTDSSRIIIVETGDTTVGMIVDAVAEVLKFSSGNVSPPPGIISGAGSDYVRGIVLDGDRLVILVNIDGILKKTEIEDLEHILSGPEEPVQQGV